jgi:hypothetical protein
VLFRLPVLGRRRPLPDPLRIVYLFVALPMLDLAGVYDVLAGDQAGGLAMIASMLPAALIAVGVAWRWLVAEDRAEPGARLRSEPVVEGFDEVVPAGG